MRRRFILLLAMLCTLAMALPVIAHADSTVSGELVGQEDQTKIQFGSYPQTEIVGEASQSGIYGKDWAVDGDYVVDADLYASLQKASYDSNGDTTINGKKYRRIKKSNAIFFTRGDWYYNWSDSTTYHYFRYDPITWRVLSNDGSDAFLLAEIALDAQNYNTSDTGITWEKSTIRSWLNGYDAAQNTVGRDYSSKNFIDTAFTSAEQSAIATADVVNADNINYGTEGGKDTQDKIFLLSESEVYGNAATAYGFASSYDTYDTARRAKSSSYAKAMGTLSSTDSSYLGNCDWWLRSPGESTRFAARVNTIGYVYSNGGNVYISYGGDRPALHLNLKSSNLWNYYKATKKDMTLSQTEYNYDGTAKKPAITIDGLTEGKDFIVGYQNNKEVGTATACAIGTGDWSGTLTKTFKIGYDISNKTIALSQTSFTYTGSAIKPEITIEGLTAGTDYTVSYSNNTKAGTATVKATGTGNYTGTISRTFEIKKLDISTTEPKLSQSEYIYDGDAKTPVVAISGLAENTDFTTAYSDNTEVGTARVTVTGTGSCEGNTTLQFRIGMLFTGTIRLDCESFTYTGAEIRPQATIEGYTEGTDYELVYSRNVNAGTATVKATGTGSYIGSVSKDFTIEPESIEGMDTTLSGTTFTYDGTEKRPGVTIKELAEGTDYTVSYSANKNAGKATVTVTGTGNYTGTITENFSIVPKGTYIKSLSKSKKAFTAKWKKQSTQTNGYQIQYSLYSDMSSAKSKTMSKNSYTSKKVTGLKAKKKYYVRIRTYKTVSGTRYYSDWSGVKTVKTR